MEAEVYSDMRVLIVARNKKGNYAPFISEQIIALSKEGVEIEQFRLLRSGILGYVKEFPRLKKTIRGFKPDIIHAHYGLCGLFVNLQRKVPVVTTYHGSDINLPKVFWLSKIAIKLSAFNIFVSQKNLEKASPTGRFALIPCGINLTDFPNVKKEEARKNLNLKLDKNYILFAGAFDNPVKNAPLAQSAVSSIENVELLELKGYTRSEVSFLLHAVDALLMTSFSEGSPQIIKEALACGCPIVSVDVGDVSEMIRGVEGCYIAERKTATITSLVKKAISFGRQTSGRKVIVEKGLTNDLIASKLIGIYRSV